MSVPTFSFYSTQELLDVFERILSFVDSTIDDCADIEYNNELVGIIDKQERVFIINKHSFANQVWISSPTNGPSHFAYNAATGEWLNTENGSELFAVLQIELDCIKQFNAQYSEPPTSDEL
ncbi:frataxin domain-containing protein [Candidatus Sarmatiella mevalonica]|uniref:frataxin domain-containing protein n=1 Tax=Candidatus Sarmatiella mevalonica TaxID=2770581 RepID=UPI001923A726